MRKLGMISLLAVITAMSPMVAFAGEPVSTKIEVSCESYREEETLTYTIQNSDEQESSHEAIDNEKIELKHGESGEFNLSFNLPGLYSYEINQTPGRDPGINYDDTIYNAIVSVTENDEGIMTPEVILYKKGSESKVERCQFLNGSKNESSDGNIKNDDTPPLDEEPETDDEPTEDIPRQNNNNTNNNNNNNERTAVPTSNQNVVPVENPQTETTAQPVTNGTPIGTTSIADGKVDQVKTGDNTPIERTIAIMLISLIILLLAAMKIRKKNLI